MPSMASDPNWWVGGLQSMNVLEKEKNSLLNMLSNFLQLVRCRKDSHSAHGHKQLGGLG